MNITLSVLRLLHPCPRGEDTALAEINGRTDIFFEESSGRYMRQHGPAGFEIPPGDGDDWSTIIPHHRGLLHRFGGEPPRNRRRCRTKKPENSDGTVTDGELNVYWVSVKAELFKNGESQAVRLPKEFRFRGKEVFIKRQGNSVVLIPEEDSWDTLIESAKHFTEDFMAERNQPPVQQRESFNA